MTEITEAPARHIIDPVAFFAALIGAPLIFTAATFWLLFIPVGALIVGGLPYLVFGTPMLLIHLRRHRAQPGKIAWLAFVTCVIGVVLGTAVTLTAPGADRYDILVLGAFTLVFASIFSTCWGATFGWLYSALARDFYTAARLT